jgi:glucose-6-phosphate dehydrogenase assembly protein OpcA
MTEEAGLWAEQDTTPGAIADALRNMLAEQHAEDSCYVPARVLNLVAVVDREWRGEIDNRLEGVGRYHPSRTILCCVEPGRSTIDAQAMMRTEGEPQPGEMALAHERIVVDIGSHHLEHLDTIVDPLVVTDLATLVWSPHGHSEAVDALLGLAQVVLVDSQNEPDPGAAVRRARELSREAYLVDLSWLRSTPWRERIAASFDPPQWLDELGKITSVEVRHRPDSSVAGVLFFGWLASRLGWEPSALMPVNGSLRGKLHSKRVDVALALVSDPRQNAPGLAGITVETASGLRLSLDRGPGGLSAHRRGRDGGESHWTVLGASRGESGILGEGIRQALLRDPAYRSALEAAETLVS